MSDTYARYREWYVEFVRNGNGMSFQLDLFPQLKHVIANLDNVDTSNPNSLRMKAYNGQTHLLYCCGHHPATCSGGYIFDNKVDEKNYHDEHAHHDAYTIDMCFFAYPDCVANAKTSVYPWIPDGSFHTVTVEGGRFKLTHTFISEMVRLMKDGARCVDAENNVLFTKSPLGLTFQEDTHLLGGYPDIFDFVNDGVYQCDSACPCHRQHLWRRSCPCVCQDVVAEMDRLDVMDAKICALAPRRASCPAVCSQ